MDKYSTSKKLKQENSTYVQLVHKVLHSNTLSYPKNDGTISGVNSDRSLPGREDRATLASDPSARPGRTAPGDPALSSSHISGGYQSAKRHTLIESWVQFLERIGEASGGWLIFGTLTFEFDKHPEQADKQLRRYLNSLNSQYFTRRERNRGKGLTLAVADERQRRGVIHYHFIGAGHEALRTANKNDLGRAWWNQGLDGSGRQQYTGLARIENIRHDVRVRAYVAKYVVKAGAGMDVNVPARTRRSMGQLACLRHIPAGR